MLTKSSSQHSNQINALKEAFVSKQSTVINKVIKLIVSFQEHIETNDQRIAPKNKENTFKLFIFYIIMDVKSFKC